MQQEILTERCFIAFVLLPARLLVFVIPYLIICVSKARRVHNRQSSRTNHQKYVAHPQVNRRCTELARAEDGGDNQLAVRHVLQD